MALGTTLALDFDFMAALGTITSSAFFMATLDLAGGIFFIGIGVGHARPKGGSFKGADGQTGPKGAMAANTLAEIDTEHDNFKPV